MSATDVGEIMDASMERLETENRSLREMVVSQNHQMKHMASIIEGIEHDRKPREKLQPNDDPRCYAYLRASHIDSVESGLGIDSQMYAFEQWWDFQRKLGNMENMLRGTAGWVGGYEMQQGDGMKRRVKVGQPRTDGVFIDKAISAYKVHLNQRPAGAVLDRTLKNGDTIVFPRLDRAFRNLDDFSTTMPSWQRRGVNIVFINPSVEMNSAAGRMMAQIMCVFAEFQSAYTSERNKEAAFRRIHNGINSKGKIAAGFKSDGKGGAEPDWRKRHWYKYVRDYVLSRGGNFGITGSEPRLEIREMEIHVEAKVAQEDGRQPAKYKSWLADAAHKRPWITAGEFRSAIARFDKYGIPYTPEEQDKNPLWSDT